MTTKKLSGIYTITNRSNGKVYIGESLDIYRRWHEEHIPQLRKNCHYNKELQNGNITAWTVKWFIYSIITV